MVRCGLEQSDMVVIRNLCKGKRCLELGTYYGKSAVFMAEHGAKSVLTIDSYEPKYNIPFSDVQENIKKYADKIELVVGKTLEYSFQVPDNSFDLLFIDAGHWYQDVLQDYLAYINKLVIGGVVLFHDYNEIHPEVVSAVDYIYINCSDKLTKIDLSEHNSNIIGFYYGLN